MHAASSNNILPLHKHNFSATQSYSLNNFGGEQGGGNAGVYEKRKQDERKSRRTKVCVALLLVLMVVGIVLVSKWEGGISRVGVYTLID